MAQWARNWLERERTKGVKRLEIKVKGRNHYIYESTTHWDNVIKKRVKTSRYIGKLDQEKGLIKSRGMNKFRRRAGSKCHRIRQFYAASFGNGGS